MTSFSLEDALSYSACVPSTRRPNAFVRWLLESHLRGDHFNVDVCPPKAPMPPQIMKARRPRLVDGAHEEHIIPGRLSLLEAGWASENAAPMKIPAEGDSSLTMREGENVGEHSQWLEFLCKNGPNFLMKNLKEKETVCSMLLNMADNVKVLPPANDPLPWDILNISLSQASVCELIKEMKTVEEKCPSLLRNSGGVYVLTSSPYAAFLRALAVEIADRCTHQDRVELTRI